MTFNVHPASFCGLQTATCACFALITEVPSSVDISKLDTLYFAAKLD